MMNTYGDLRKSLKEKPVGWTLADDVPDDIPLLSFPTMEQQTDDVEMNVPKDDELREYILSGGCSNPVLQNLAIVHGLCTEGEVKDLIQRFWGPDFSFKDFSEG
jgi:hypothetical protein